MPDIPTPPKPPGPGQVAGAAKGKLSKLPKWAWIAGAFVLVGVAWMTFKNQTSGETAADPLADPMNDVNSQLFPGPTQGAFAGGDVPPLDGGGTVDGGDGLETALTLLDFIGKQRSDDLAQFAAMMPAPVAAPDLATPDPPVAEAAGVATAAAVTGGGPPGRTVTNHLGTPKPVVKNGKFYHVYNAGKKNEKWIYVRPASHTAAVAKRPAAAPAAPAAKHPAGTPTPPAPVSHQPVSTTPRNVVKNGKFYHVYNYGTAQERWVYVRPASH